MSVRCAPDLQDGMVHQGHLGTRRRELGEKLSSPAAHLGPPLCLGDSLCGQRPWPESQAVAVGAASASPDMAEGAAAAQ